MKPLELTQDHQDKILEMSSVLFSDYEFIGLDIEPEYDGSEYYMKIFKDNQRELIHWFEFCHNHLSSKVFGVDRYKERVQFYIDTFGGNPIDYLYQEFKKLK